MKKSELKDLIKESIREILTEAKEELVLPRTVYSGEGKPIDYSSEIKRYKVGDYFVSHAGAPGIGKSVHKITKIDQKGVWGTVVSNTIRISNY